MPGTLAEEGPGLGIEMTTRLKVNRSKTYGIDVLAVFLEIIGAHDPVQPVIKKTGAQQLKFLSDLLLIVDVNQIGYSLWGAILVAFKKTVEFTPGTYRFEFEFVIDIKVNGQCDTPDIQFRSSRVSTKIQSLAAVIYIAGVKARGIIEIRRVFAGEEIKRKTRRWVDRVKKDAVRHNAAILQLSRDRVIRRYL